VDALGAGPQNPFPSEAYLMAILEVLRYPDPMLREVSTPAELNDDTYKFIDAMVTTMFAHRGAGLSAVQVGSLQRIFVIDSLAVDGPVGPSARASGAMVFVNPEIIAHSEKMATADEGCLSFPGIFVSIKRPYAVTIRAKNQYGTEFELDAEGLQARVVQHEFDHLNGTLIIDRVSRIRRQLLYRKLHKGSAK